MDNTLLTIVVLFCGFVLGGVAGWFLTKSRLEASATVADSLRMQLDGVVAERDAAKKDVETRRTELEALGLEKARLEQDAGNFESRLKELREAREEMLGQFKVVGGEVLKQNREDFLKRAEERFEQSAETGEQKIKALLKPVGDRLKEYEESVKAMEADRKKDYGNISSLMDQVRVGQEAVKVEASNIVSSLRSAPKTSGRWGEQQFENLLDMAGLSKFTDYQSEVSVRSDDGLLRPDFIINLPGGRQLIVDIKCPLDTYLSATEILDPAEKKKAFERYADAVKGHATALSKKSYWSQFENAPDFVILYIPGDNFHAAALEHKPTLWEDAARNHVIISGPATFLPLARTISTMWDQEKLTDKAQEILDLGRELHENLSIMTNRIRTLGQNIDRTAKSYNDFITSVDGKVILKARRFEELNLTKSEKRLVALEPVETQSRTLARLTTPEADKNAAIADQSKDAKTS